MEKEKLTQELLDELLFTSSLAGFLQEELDKPLPTAAEYLKTLLEEKGMKKGKVIKDSGLVVGYGYQVFSGDRQGAKDTLLCIAVAMGLSLTQTQRLLKIGKAGELYCKNKRDAIIIYGINKGQTLSEIDENLYAFDQKTLGEAE